MLKSQSIVLLACAAILTGMGRPSPALADDAPIETTVTVDAGKTLRTMEPQRLGGTNVALWYVPQTFHAPEVVKLVEDLHPHYVRIPGGSWSNVVYWNGNGVRRADGTVDPDKIGPDGYPAVDYSDYAPSFLVDAKTLHPASNGWHGHVDVKTLHEWIKGFPGTEAMACPNAGTGRPIDAAEWVKWANKKMGYNIRQWEIGNELGGSWEAGTEMPLGRGPLTAEIYTARYNEMARLMRQADPTIKIGSCPYVEEALRDCGENVDFVSIHTYPGSTTLSERQMFADIGKLVAQQVGEVKGWIHKYQPQREKQIEICYSEWNLSGGLDNGHAFSALWSAIFLGEIAKNGVAMATQWDCFADLIYLPKGDPNECLPKAEYYALWLWNNYMGDRLIPAKSSGEPVYTYASRTDDAVMVMLVNTDLEREAQVHVQLSNFDAADRGEIARVSSREYHWNDLERRPQWSKGATIEQIKAGADVSVTLAPFSMACVRVPSRAKAALSTMAQKALAAKNVAKGEPALRLLLPAEVYAGDQVRGELLALAGNSKVPFHGALAPADVTANADAVFDRKQVRLADAVGHFTMKATAPGELTITAQSGDLKVSKTINVKPSVPRPMVFWDFANPPVADKDVFSSSFSLSEDLTQRANRAVARVDIPTDVALPEGRDKHLYLLSVGRLPQEDRLNKANIRGVIADMKTSADFQCDDPNACILVTMQGPANWWMKIGTIPLQGATKWKSYQLDVTNEEYFKALPSAGNILFVLQTNKPPKGSIYLDRIGFMVR